MQLSNHSIAQTDFASFPAFENKVTSYDGFRETARGFLACLILCSMQGNCNVAFYDNMTTTCYGANDRSMMKFLGSLTLQSGLSVYRMSSGCDSAGYISNWRTGQCLKIVTELTMWDDARQFCEDTGGVLVKLDTRERMEGAMDISRIYLDTYENFWIGATDIASEGKWVWLDGTIVEGMSARPFVFNDLDMEFGSQPPADCARFAMALLLVSDDNCIGKKYFICEQRELELK